MTQPIDDDDPPEDEEGIDDDDDDEEPEVATAEGAPVGPEAIGMGRPVDRHGNPRKRLRRKREGKPRGTIPQDATKPQEADLLWPVIIAEIAKKGVEPRHVQIRVARVDTGRETTLGYLQGDSVQGTDDATASDALYNAVVDRYHLTSPSRGPILYKIQFNVRGSVQGTGYLKLAAPEEIYNQRMHQQQPQHQQQPWWPPHPGVGAPPQQYGGPQGYGQPQHYPPPSQAPRGRRGEPPHQEWQQPPRPYDEVSAMRDEMREMKHMFREVLMGRPAAAPGPDWAALTGAMESLEKMFGVKLTVAQSSIGLGAAPVAPLPPARDAEAADYEKALARKIRARIEKKFEQGVDELFDPKPVKPPPPAEEEEEEEKPEADFEVVEVPGGVVWPGTTTPMRYARDRETGEFSWLGTALGNPHAVDKYGEKIVDFVGKIADGIKSGGLAGLGGRPQMPQQTQQQQPRENMNGPATAASPPAQQEPRPPAQQSGSDDDFSL